MPPIRRYQPIDHQNLMSFLAHVFKELGREFLPDQKDSDIRDIETVYLQNRAPFLALVIRGQIQGSVGIRRYSDAIASALTPLLTTEGLGEVGTWILPPSTTPKPSATNPCASTP